MPKQRCSMSFDSETMAELIGLTIYRRDFSQSAKTNAAAAAIHAAYSKLPSEVKRVIEEQNKRARANAQLEPVEQFNAMCAHFEELYSWMQECKAREASKSV